ncbi:MAG: ATP-dependent zinc metalloprotease FtsH [Candidatus Eiseniibacteriota bacterium]|jgi:cell division protease FtsH
MSSDEREHSQRDAGTLDGKPGPFARNGEHHAEHDGHDPDWRDREDGDRDERDRDDGDRDERDQDDGDRDERAPGGRSDDARRGPRDAHSARDDGDRRPGAQRPLLGTKRFNLSYALLALLGVLVLHNLWMGMVTVTTIPYSEFQRLLRENKIAEVVISTDQIHGELKQEENGVTRFVTTRVEEDLAATLDEHGVTYTGRLENTFLMTLLSWMLPALLFIGVWIFLLRRIMSRGGPGGGLMSIGKSKAKVYVETDTKVTFKDVAGVDEATAELEEIVSFLRSPRSYGRLGARMPKGVLLVGPPGTGKTLLARAVAGEAGVPFFSISGSEFVEMFVGVGAARVRDLFEQARRQAPCIIFIDELDAMGRARSQHPGFGGHDEKEQTLNQLLVELDGFDPTSGIVLIGATNRPEILDQALLRAGRFDRQVLVDRPDKIGRADILRVHMKGVSFATDADPEKIAALTPGFTGADLANLVNEAALVATRRHADTIAMQDFTAAIERIVAGLERKNRLLNEHERRVVAHHEMGHALVAAALPGADGVHKVSIIPRGIGALGYTIQRPTDDRYLMTKEELEVKMTILLGGRVAEHIIFGHLSTGAADDLQKITQIARSMVTRYAMVPELGHVTYDSEPTSFLGPTSIQTRQFSEDTAREIDCAVRRIVQRVFARAEQILTENREVLEESAAELLERETLDEEALRPLFARVTLPGDELPDPVVSC